MQGPFHLAEVLLTQPLMVVVGDKVGGLPTMFMRDASKLADIDTSGMQIVEGDVGDRKQLLAAINGQDVVYANLSGEVDVLAKNIVAVMKEAGVKRLIFIASLGIYDEVPGKFGKWNRRETVALLEHIRRQPISSKPQTSTTRSSGPHG